LKGEIKVPKILYIANKAEDGYEGDILGDFFQKFPGSAWDEEMEPIFVSAEHGDGLADLYGAIKEHIPPEKFVLYENQKEKRLQRYLGLKAQLMDEVIDLKLSQGDGSDHERPRAVRQTVGQRL